MRALNVLLCFVVSIVLVLIVLEVGLRMLGKGPQQTINRFDPDTGWSKTPSSTSERKTSEFDVHYEINALGLRDDPMDSPLKPAGKYRVLMLGDSFVLGYTVERKDLFVDLCEKWWQAEGRDVDVINAGTEGYSTDQEAAWLEKYGASFQPDVVVLFPYENDLFWNTQTHYGRFSKPRYTTFGERERIVLQDPGPRPGFERFALGLLWSGLHETSITWSPDDVHWMGREDAAFFKDPPSFMKDAIARTRGGLVAMNLECQKIGAKLYVAPIPGKAAIHLDALKVLADRLNNLPIAARLKFWNRPPTIPPATWSPDQPVETFLGLCQALSIPAFDARPFLRDQAKSGEKLYYAADWHFNPDGNRAFATFLHDELDKAHAFPESYRARTSATLPPKLEKARGVPTALYAFAALWALLGTGYALTYRDEPWWKSVLGVGVLLGLVFGIAIGGGKLLALFPPSIAQILLLLFVVGLFSFIAYKLGRRIGTIAELFTAFTRRGHWYLMPLIAVLLTVGSLLVVAASSPLIAPFIYTLF